ncbi:MAG: hypothetical protein ROZ00_07300 [Denitratisoma sp.]|nr:hypothetical protein [Denitratisoma sp.]
MSAARNLPWKEIDSGTFSFPDCRHSPHKDQPQATLEAMAGFIERIG